MGARIRLSAVRDEDVPTVATWQSDLGLQRLVNPGGVGPMTTAYLLDPNGWFMADRKNKQAFLFAVRTTLDNQFIGISAINNMNVTAHHAEIGINLGHSEYQSKGYGGDVMLTTMRFGFEQLNLNRIWLNVFAYNTRAIRLYEKLGFVHEVCEREMLYRDGQYYDNLQMGLLRTEWEERYG
jgi:RimJ/RimL family protein N-acetyltransferase